MTDGGVSLGIAAARRLAELDCCEIAPGLTDAEFARIEAEQEFEFADDHRAFLAAGLPVNSPYEPEPGVFHTWEQPWPEWRGGDPDELRRWIDRPVSGVMWEVEQDAHWNPLWGDRPDTLEAAVEVARRVLADVPRLIPVFGHRFLPAGRGTSGHPVLSMWGTDIISYGLDLAHYVGQEFDKRLPKADFRPNVTVPFWRDYADLH